MKVHHAVLALALLGASGSALAEGGCPQGQVPYDTPQARQCVPIPGGPGTGASQPAAIYEDRWGAIAVDGTVREGGIGTVAGMPSKRKAQKAALEQCRATGGGDGCKISLAYYNQCAVIASGDTWMQPFGGPEVESTSERALGVCRQHTTNCVIWYSACSYPQRVQ